MNSDGGELRNKKSGMGEWLKAFLAVGVVLVLYRYVQNSGWLGSVGAESANLTFGISFLTGLAASVSSCLAVVGAVVIAFAQKYDPANNSAERNNEAGGGDGNKKLFYHAIKPNLLFHAGRIATFFVLGGVLGAIGGVINLSGNFVAVYTIIIALVIAWLGLNILGIVPPPAALGIRLPKSFTRFWIRLEESEHKAAPALLGGFTFFLPCGFTQSMQILALASGSFWAGGLNLAIFALGTLPVLLALGISTSWGRQKKAGAFQKAVGILILVFAVYTLQSGFAVKPSSLPLPPQTPSQSPPSQGERIEEVQKIEMKITSWGFEPNIIRIKNNVPVEFVINGDGATGCTNKIIIPSLNVEKNITSGENIVKFTPRGKGNISFSCWMGMVRGKFIVE